MRDIEKLIGKKIPVIDDHPFPLIDNNPAKAPKQQRNNSNHPYRKPTETATAGNNNKRNGMANQGWVRGRID